MYFQFGLRVTLSNGYSCRIPLCLRLYQIWNVNVFPSTLGTQFADIRLFNKALEICISHIERRVWEDTIKMSHQSYPGFLQRLYLCVKAEHLVWWFKMRVRITGCLLWFSILPFNLRGWGRNWVVKPLGVLY